MIDQFITDVVEGLSKEQKTLPSKYFYDEKGDQLFVDIMNMPEYYLTNCEMEIFSDQASALAQLIGHETSFDLIELGAGDGTKTVHLLRALQQSHDFTYKPIDISPFAIEGLLQKLSVELPELKTEGVAGDYFSALAKFKEINRPISILFMGSNIGNLTDDKAKKFIGDLSQSMKPGDKLLIGVDLKKDPSIILPAYNDAQGITRDFNMNLLDRMNRELDADFNLEQFKHAPVYDEQIGEARSYLVSKSNQSVAIGKANKIFHFEEGERIHTETSRKYDAELIKELTCDHGLTILKQLTDSRGYFSDFILEKQNT
ncbi:L-histidine N(alpha)-methyltransferase [Sanyastnella coralliicola]|uniref:L-histidine N(alpha)-methyltransferase n=1 Tax=Sanyastnella coralliicola TaxID=3069118 RepID=UPI0027B8C309|nr:L-histidine N(alpha)-methyltransferase [Longitalea sp. SCSIO 12813]